MIEENGGFGAAAVQMKAAVVVAASDGITIQSPDAVTIAGNTLSILEFFIRYPSFDS